MTLDYGAERPRDRDWASPSDDWSMGEGSAPYFMFCGPLTPAPTAIRQWETLTFTFYDRRSGGCQKPPYLIPWAQLMTYEVHPILFCSIHCKLVDPSIVICSFVILGASGLFCRFYSITNSEDPYQTPQYVASDLGLHCLQGCKFVNKTT